MNAGAADVQIPAERQGRAAPADIVARRDQLIAAEKAGYFRTDPPAQTVSFGGVGGLRFRSAGRSQVTVLHLHGGGFRLGSAAMAGPFAARLAARCDVEVICPEYRLAPEYPFPAGLNDAKAVMAAMRESGAGALILSGDSAGGGLAAALTAICVAEGAPPLGLVLLSPWLDLTLASNCYETNAATDPMFSRASATEAAALYLQGLDPTRPLASPMYAALDGFPPTLVSIGEGEVLADDGKRFHAALRATGAPVELSAIDGMEHVAVTRDLALTGAAETFDAVAAFIDRLTTARETG